MPNNNLELFTCPCCGYPTLPERGGYYVCQLCKWEDDNQDDPHADKIWGGPNSFYSLTEARINFSLYFIMYSPNAPTKRISGNDNTPLEQEAKRAMVENFDAMLVTNDLETLSQLWYAIQKNKETLRNETKRKVREYEEQKAKK